ncbi:LysE family translocator (plasmid) [Thioclava litoralis]|uniref:LysE family translocator n=1 Tax=Thioclava litoralis TaxID=3076557 RepID=A0ABZ1E2R9_9RHOB|nr:LysE family translocator [Thioclava sp. FTW29]
MNLTLLSVYLTSIVLLIATPGPVVALVLNTAAKRGLREAVLTVFGTNWASLFLIGAAALVISGLMTINVRMLTWVSLIGCLFIAWMAIQSFRHRPTSQETDPTEALGMARRGSSPLLHGFLVGISNPKDILFFVAFFPQFVGITSRHEISLIILTLLWILFDFAILVSYAAVIHTRVFRRQAHRIAQISAGFLLCVAIAGFAYSLNELLSVPR